MELIILGYFSGFSDTEVGRIEMLEFPITLLSYCYVRWLLSNGCARMEKSLLSELFKAFDLKLKIEFFLS